ncbi:hypothetical protein M0805_003070 [Coniferiporia weirii]|nr:hypothetical protein M0805_003070 [Coniferiporia weirii]
MSLSLLRCACQRSQTPFLRGSGHLIIRLNSTSTTQKTSATQKSADGRLWENLFTPKEIKRSDGRTPEAKWRKASEDFLTKKALPPRDAYFGRSIAVRNGDVAGAAKALDRVLSINSVAKEWRSNRRHKPKGEERRKLASLRWRRRFKDEVGKKVELVQQIRRRGA